MIFVQVCRELAQGFQDSQIVRISFHCEEVATPLHMRACVYVYALGVVGVAFAKPEPVSQSSVPVYVYCKYVRYTGLGGHHQCDANKNYAYADQKNTDLDHVCWIGRVGTRFGGSTGTYTSFFEENRRTTHIRQDRYGGVHILCVDIVIILLYVRNVTKIYVQPMQVRLFELDGYGDVPGCCTHPTCEYTVIILLYVQISRQT